MALQFGSEVDRFPSLTDVPFGWVVPTMKYRRQGMGCTGKASQCNVQVHSYIGIEHSRRSDFSLTSFL